MSDGPGQPRQSGLFVAFEGGDGAGKSTQARQLAARLRQRGHTVVLTHEPGASRIGPVVRNMVLDPANAGLLSDRAEALLYAADRAEHVASVVRPALQRGEVVLTDRYVDSSIAYQGVGRGLGAEAVAELSAFATGGLVPDMTVVLDVPAGVGRGRFDSADRLESESAEFHERVRRAFLELAAADPDRYLVVDGTLPVDEVTKRIAPLVEALAQISDLAAESRQ